MKVKSMKGGRCPNCNCGKRGGAYGGHSKLSGSQLMKGGAKKSLRKSKRGGVRKTRRTRKTRVKRGGSLKCPGFKLNLKDQIKGLSVVERYETCESTN